MTTTPRPPIRATISPKFLSRVDRVFDASPLTVFNELLQNSRRAGSTEVTVELRTIRDATDNLIIGVGVKFTNNGNALTSPDVLLQLADNGWTQDTVRTEDAAGMGFFCLSNFPAVRVSSHDWVITVTPEVFRGEVDCQPDYCPAESSGLRLEWVWPDVQVAALAAALEKAAMYCGIRTVRLLRDDSGPRCMQVNEFLLGAAYTMDVPELGCRLGVMDHRRASYEPMLHLNFGGVTLAVSIVDNDPLQELVTLDREVRVDVYRADYLHLVLPARNALKHNAGREALFLAAERCLLQWVAQTSKGTHHLPYSVYQRALSLGIDIGEASPLYDRTRHRWSGPHLTDEEAAAARALRVPADLADPMLLYAWDHSQCWNDACLVTSHLRYEGYSWYDAMPTVTEAAIIINGHEVALLLFVAADGQFADFNLPPDAEARAEQSCHYFVLVDTLEMQVKTSAGVVYRSPLLVAVSGDHTGGSFDYSLNDRKVFISRAQLEQSEAATGLITDCIESLCFDACDDFEADSYDTQLDDYRSDCEAAVVEAIGGEEMAARHQITNALRSVPKRSEWAWLASCDGNGAVSLDVLTKACNNLQRPYAADVVEAAIAKAEELQLTTMDEMRGRRMAIDTILEYLDQK